MNTKMVIIGLVISVLGLIRLDASDMFQTYQENRTKENFLNAYEALSEDQNEIMNAYLLYMELERYTAIIETKMDSLDLGSQFSFANLLLELGKYDQSITIYEKLNEQAPKWSCPWRHKGEALMKKNELEQAEIALKKAIETRIEHYDAYIMLADVQMQMKKYEEALSTFNMGLLYKGKDIEDPEEEVNQIDEKILHLKLLKHNNKKNEYKKLKTDLIKKYPQDPRVKNLK